MKAITIKQPYASLIVEGLKDIENRTWKCPEKYIGKRVMIHASYAKNDHIIRRALNDAQYSEFIKRFKHSGLDFLEPKSAIIGSVEIVNCVINQSSIWAEKSFCCTRFEKCKKWNNDSCNQPGICVHHFEHEKPIYNWVLANPIKFKNPIPIKGSPYFWESECEILICNQCGQYCLHNNKDVGVPNWGNPVHICEHCGNMMLESEYEYLK